IPRRSDPDRLDGFHIAMLTMFAPWTNPIELVSDDMSLQEQYQQMRDQTSLYHLKVIDNMQLLHECKDSRD
ncbi:hypothetical protein BDN72DRAFT_743229, partial [Pluteus cervinus]